METLSEELLFYIFSLEISRSDLLSVLRTSKVFYRIATDAQRELIFSNTSLLIAVDNRSCETVRYLLTHQWSGKIEPSINGQYCLLTASLHGCTEIVRLLLTYPTVNPRVNERPVAYGNDLDYDAEYEEEYEDHDPLGLPPLILAARSGVPELVTLLLAQPGIDVETHNSMALIVAATNGYTEVVKVLVEDGRSDATSLIGKAFRYALNDGHFEIADLVTPTKIDKEILTEALSLCVHNNKLTAIQYLMRSYDIDLDGPETADLLHVGPDDSWIVGVRCLIQEYQQQIANGRKRDYLLYTAIDRRRFSIVENLIDNCGYDPRIGAYHILKRAITADWTELVSYWLSFPGVELGVNALELLEIALRGKNPEMIELLLTHSSYLPSFYLIILTTTTAAPIQDLLLCYINKQEGRSAPFELMELN